MQQLACGDLRATKMQIEPVRRTVVHDFRHVASPERAVRLLCGARALLVRATATTEEQQEEERWRRGGEGKDRGQGDENEKDRSRASRTRAKLQLKRRAAMPSQKKTNSLRKTALATAERSTLRFFVLRGPTRRYHAGAHIHCITIRHTRKRCVCQRNSPSGRLTSNFRHVKGRVCG